ncbi:hypothetical protein DFQ29_003723, partial [Apophysomyces sp. BC1021]
EERENVHAQTLQSQAPIQEEDTPMENTDSPSGTSVDQEKLEETLRNKKKTAANRLMLVLASESSDEQERLSAQWDLNAANVSWEAFLEAKKAQEDVRESPTEGQTPAMQNKLATLVPKDLPAFQIRGGPIRDKNKKVHDSVRTFISAFEVQLRAYNLVPLDNHWERLFWLTCDDTQ